MDREQAKSTTVTAFMELLPWSKEEGRRTPIDCSAGYYRPDHQFSWVQEDWMFIGQITFPKYLQKLEPGDSAEVTIAFISYPELDEKLRPGLTWRIKEGNRTVAKATLLRIIEM